MNAPTSNPEISERENSFATHRDLLQGRIQEVKRWHQVANAASVALFGVSVIHTTTAARAAWWEVSKFVRGLSRARKATHKA